MRKYSKLFIKDSINNLPELNYFLNWVQNQDYKLRVQIPIKVVKSE